MACLEPLGCAGGTQSNCSTGYKGVLCHDCVGKIDNITYYARSGSHKCTLCNDIEGEIAKFIGIVAIMLIYVALMVYLMVDSPQRKKDHSVMMRIITNHLQVVLLVKNLDLNWPKMILDFLAGISFVSAASNDLFNINCFFKVETQST